MTKKVRGALPELFPRNVCGVRYQVARFGDAQRSYGRWRDKAGVRNFGADLAVWLQNGRAWPEEPEAEMPSAAPVAVPSVLTVSELVDRYLAAQRNEHDEDWWERNDARRRHALEPFAELNGTAAAAEIGPATIKAFQRHLCGLKRKDGITSKLTVKSVNEKVTAVVKAFSWAITEELVPGGCAHALREVSKNQPVKAGRPGMRGGENVQAPKTEWIDATQLRDEHSVEVAAAILGHTTTEMTEKHYAGPALKKAPAAIELAG